MSGLPEPVHQHLQGLITDQVRVLWEHGSLLVTASRELDLRLRLVAGKNIQGLAMGGGGGFVGGRNLVGGGVGDGILCGGGIVDGGWIFVGGCSIGLVSETDLGSLGAGDISFENSIA